MSELQRLFVALCLSVSGLSCGAAFALQPLTTLSEPTARMWREDLFDRDLVNSPNNCTGLMQSWAYDPTWLTYSHAAGLGSATGSGCGERDRWCDQMTTRSGTSER